MGCTRRIWLVLLALFMGLGLAAAPAFAQQKPNIIPIAPAAVFTEETQKIVADAFIYAYPMLYNYKTLYGQAVDSSAKEYVGGFGRFRNYSQPYTPADKEIVTPNNDTPYSWAWLDLRAEPWVLSVPAVPRDRYNVFQFVDLFTFNYAYVGVRATGFEAGNYLFPGPNWKGETATGIQRVFPSETDFVMILGRTSLNGPGDVANVQTLQRQYRLQPLSAFLKQQAPAASAPVNWIPWDEKKAMSPEFIAYLNQLLQFTQPTNPSEVALMGRFAKIGIGPGKPFDFAALSPAVQKALEVGVKEGQERIKQAGDNTPSSIGLFGTRDFLKNDYLKRAVAAALGIYGNSAEEAVYVGEDKDASETSVDSQYNYVLHFNKKELPPAKFFWSTTMYELPGRHLVENSIKRYSIGDRTKGLKYGDDGSLTIYIQRTSPGKDKQSNWLPSPAEGPFNIVTRIYGPSEAAIKGQWQMPKIQKQP